MLSALPLGLQGGNHPLANRMRGERKAAMAYPHLPTSPFDVSVNVNTKGGRRAKSKSGPINVHPEIGYYQNCSPSMGVLDGGIVRSFMVNSPFSTGVSMPNGDGSHYSGSGVRNRGKGHVGTFG
ncbi:remorin family protein [Populus alba x Populus x berolinensis]|nr:remorin family protein [Populus alba x Populus x berolinensis]